MHSLYSILCGIAHVFRAIIKAGREETRGFSKLLLMKEERLLFPSCILYRSTVLNCIFKEQQLNMPQMSSADFSLSRKISFRNLGEN